MNNSFCSPYVASVLVQVYRTTTAGRLVLSTALVDDERTVIALPFILCCTNSETIQLVIYVAVLILYVTLFMYCS
jgi:hypothetical protein